MSYDVHITRKENWFDKEESLNISLNEWIEYLNSDSEMRLDSYAETRTPNNEIIRMESEGIAVWTKYQKNVEGENLAWFDYRRGNIVVKNPDEKILKKMFQIAQKLNAKVQGDESEIYDENGNYTLPNTSTSDYSSDTKPWWKFW